MTQDDFSFFRSEPPPPPPPIVTPAKAFGLLTAMALLAGLVLWTTDRLGGEREPTAPAPAVAQAPAPQAETDNSDQAAIDARAIFAALIRQRDRAFVDRDLDLADRIYAKDGPVGVLARKQIRLLRRKDLLDQSRIKSLSVDIVAMTEDEIRVRQISLVRQHYVADWGPVVSSKPRERQTVLWTLRKGEDGRWLIYDAVLEDTRRAP